MCFNFLPLFQTHLQARDTFKTHVTIIPSNLVSGETMTQNYTRRLLCTCSSPEQTSDCAARHVSLYPVRFRYRVSGVRQSETKERRAQLSGIGCDSTAGGQAAVKRGGGCPGGGAVFGGGEGEGASVPSAGPPCTTERTDARGGGTTDTRVQERAGNSSAPAAHPAAPGVRAPFWAPTMCSVPGQGESERV